MNGLCLYSAGFGHPLGRSAGWRGKETAFIAGGEERNQSANNRRFSGTRASRDDRNAVFPGNPDGLCLILVQSAACNAGKLPQTDFEIFFVKRILLAAQRA